MDVGVRKSDEEEPMQRPVTCAVARFHLELFIPSCHVVMAGIDWQRIDSGQPAVESAAESLPLALESGSTQRRWPRLALCSEHL